MSKKYPDLATDLLKPSHWSKWPTWAISLTYKICQPYMHSRLSGPKGRCRMPGLCLEQSYRTMNDEEWEDEDE